MKYYICTKEVEELNDINWFIHYTFTTTNTICYYDNNRGYAYERQYNFFKGYIYHTAPYSDEYIIDGKGVSHKVIDLVPGYFAPFDFEIEEGVKEIQKKKKDDLIEITPSYIDLNGKTKYHILCRLQIGKYTKCYELYSYSQYEGIIECYKRLRTMDERYRLWHNVIKYKRR